MTQHLLLKSLLLNSALFITGICLGQLPEDQLLKLALSDSSNFKVMSFWEKGKKMPRSFYVFETTKNWRSERFYLEGLEQNITKWSRDEYHPYSITYLFTDSLLDSQFSTNEKKQLSDKAASIRSRNISLKTSLASTVSSFDSVDSGFIVWTTAPVFSSDSTYAFIDFTIIEKTSTGQQLPEIFHATVCVIYRKEEGIWKKWKMKERVAS